MGNKQLWKQKIFVQWKHLLYNWTRIYGTKIYTGTKIAVYIIIASKNLNPFTP